MAGLTSRHYKIGMILGEAVAPYWAAFDRLDRMIGKLEAEGSEIPEDLPLFFMPAEDNPRQYALAESRHRHALEWARDRYGEPPNWPAWLALAGVAMLDEVAADVSLEVPTNPEP